MKLINCCLFLLLFQGYSFAQITPPGVGKTKAASWFALAVRTNFKHNKNLSSKTYVGLGRESTPQNYNFVKKAAIYVFNHELKNNFSNHFSYATGASFRRQNMYETDDTFESKTPAIRQEVRLYGKYAYRTNFKKIGISATLREEFRSFFNTDFSNYKRPIALRTRFKTKFATNLDKSTSQKLIVAVELLFQASKTKTWNALQYQDMRFSIYYSKQFEKTPITLNIGYMDDLLGRRFSHNTHYLGIDLVFTDLF